MLFKTEKNGLVPYCLMLFGGGEYYCVSYDAIMHVI